MNKYKIFIAFLLSALGLSLVSFAAGSDNSKRNPFGLMIGGSGLDAAQRIALAKEANVVYIRPWDISILDWSGGHADTERFYKAGFKIIMTIRNYQKRASGSLLPSAPPENVGLYKKILGEVLDKYHPELLVVENEENSMLFYTGTPQQYAAQLQAACLTAHEKGIKCTNGGLVSSLVALLVSDYYRRIGDIDKAEDFEKRAFTPEQVSAMKTPKGKRKTAEMIRKGKELFDAYKISGIDYVNFHWYIKDPQALEEAVVFLKKMTGLQPVTNEIGQRDLDPGTVKALMEKVSELDLPYAVWFSLDRRSKALQNPDGTWRENGRAFKEFIQQRFLIP